MRKSCAPKTDKPAAKKIEKTSGGQADNDPTMLIVFTNRDNLQTG